MKTYIVGKGQTHPSLDSIVKIVAQGDQVNLVSDVVSMLSFPIQTGMVFNGNGHLIDQQNPKANGIEIDKWVQNAAVSNFKTKTIGSASQPTSAVYCAGQHCTVQNFSQLGSGRLFTASDSVNCTLQDGLIESHNCCDYGGYFGDGDNNSQGATGLTLTRIIIRLYLSGVHLLRGHESRAVILNDCELMGDNYDTHGNPVGTIRSICTFKEWGAFTANNTKFWGCVDRSGTLLQLLGRLQKGNIGMGLGPLQVDMDPTDYCANVTFNQCDMQLGNYLSLLAGVKAFRANGGFLICPQAAVNCSGPINGRKPPDDIQLTGVNIKAPAAWKGPGTNQSFIGCPITLPNGQVHKVSTTGQVV